MQTGAFGSTDFGFQTVDPCVYLSPVSELDAGRSLSQGWCSTCRQRRSPLMSTLARSSSRSWSVQWPCRCDLRLQGECGQWWLVRVLAGQEELLDFPLLCNKSHFIVVLVVLTAIQSSLGNFYTQLCCTASHTWCAITVHDATESTTRTTVPCKGPPPCTHSPWHVNSVACSAPPDPFKSGSGSEPQRT
jgi:hypothetical protein